jgi:hypothetical protein
MAQIFDRSSNALARASLVLTGLIVIALGVTLGQRPDQPVPFSHKHHVQGLGLQCQYCHVTVEKSSYAGIPPTKTCINCHAQIWTNAQLLEPVRHSWATGESLVWTKVHDLPDFVYFSHEIHVNKGLGCASCHGRVDLMPLMYAQNTLQMEWCLDCHRNPAKNLRPTGERSAGVVLGERRQDRRADGAERELHDQRSGWRGAGSGFAGVALDRRAWAGQRCFGGDAGCCCVPEVHQPG